MRCAQRGQAMAEYMAVLTVLVVALYWPVAGQPSVIAQLTDALARHWRAWRSALLTAGIGL
jgi:hypothetical protein